MLLDDSAGCPGKWLPFRRSHAGICIGCSRYRSPGEQIEPAARVDAHGAFFCPERRCTGTHSPDASVTGELSGVGAVDHAATVRDTCQVLQTADLGGQLCSEAHGQAGK